MPLPSWLTGDRLTLESVARGESRAVPMSGDAILCRVLGKYMLFAAPEDDSITPHLVLNGYWEPWTTLALARAVSADAHVVDIGANQGYFTVLLSDAVGVHGRVLAIEPNPRLAALLSRTLEVNGFADRCEVMPRAASCSQSVARLRVPIHRWGDASLHLASAGTDTVVDVATVTVDQATADWSHVDLIKIDAEGSEEAIWAGMQRTVRQNPGLTMVIEFKPARYADPGGLLASITAEGFILRCIEDDGSTREIDALDVLQPCPRGDWMLFLTRTRLPVVNQPRNTTDACEPP